MTDLDRIRKTKLKDLSKFEYKKYDYELTWKDLLSWLIPIWILALAFIWFTVKYSEQIDEKTMKAIEAITK
jgi:hypothetical protein